MHKRKREPGIGAWTGLAGGLSNTAEAALAPPNTGCGMAATGTESAGRERRQSILDAVNTMEIAIVRPIASTTRVGAVRALTLFINTLGNGWIYPPLILALLRSELAHAANLGWAAALAALLAHALYAPLKRLVARRRPFEHDATLLPLARVLDRYSFPSGHCMTLTAVLLPIVHAVPDLWPAAAAALCLLAWSRLASAHHYPSDVLAGIGIGVLAAAPCYLWLVPA